jgi:hypothetical protein
MIELFKPDMSEVASIAKDQLQFYVDENDLSFAKLNRKESYVVFDKACLSVLESIESGSVKLIKLFKGTEALSNDISNFLIDNEIVAFEATKSTMRHFYTVSGFVSVMSEVGEKVRNGRVCLSPGCYGSKYLFAICRR